MKKLIRYGMMLGLLMLTACRDEGYAYREIQGNYCISIFYEKGCGKFTIHRKNEIPASGDKVKQAGMEGEYIYCRTTAGKNYRYHIEKEMREEIEEIPDSVKMSGPTTFWNSFEKSTHFGYTPPYKEWKYRYGGYGLPPDEDTSERRGENRDCAK